MSQSSENINSIAGIRKEYTLNSLDESTVQPHPVQQFASWWNEAAQSEILEMNAMTLATCGASGMPEARIVLLKGFDEQGFVFFTNYQSSKSQQLLQNPQCSLLFFWKELERQVRISGRAQKISEQESEDYFTSRPAGSQLGAWASPQSQVVPNRQWLQQNYEDYAARFKEQPIPKPPHWGGWRVVPQTVEFWQGRPSRLHDRVLYTLQPGGTWSITRLAP